MSGDTVVLLDDASGSVARLVRAAAAWFDADRRRAALVGGLAVTLRLATVHRATNDVDAVVDEPADELVSAVTTDHATPIEIDGVKVDAMATSPLPVDPAELPDDDLDRLFVLGHRWALESATPRGVIVRNGEDVRADLTVATVPALLACKLHAIADRRDARAAKRESDARDIYRLTQLIARDGTFVSELATSPFDLVALVQEGVQKWLIDDVTRTARLLAMGAGVGESTPGPAELAAVGRLFTSTVSQP